MPSNDDHAVNPADCGPLALIDDSWAVRASVSGGRMPYSRTRRIDVDHPFRAVATHSVDLTDPVQRAHALGLLLDGRSAISHSTAAFLLGFPLPRRLRLEVRLHISVPRPARAPKGEGVHGHSLTLPARAVSRRLMVSPATGEQLPVPLVSDAMILVTCASQLAVPDLVALADAMMRRALNEQRPDPMVRALAMAVGRPGRRTLNRAAVLRRAGVRSRAESLLRLMIAEAGLPEPVAAYLVRSTTTSTVSSTAQSTVRSSGSATAGSTVPSVEMWAAEADLAWPQFTVLLEYEGDVHRTSRRQFSIDVRRFDRYADEGWRAIRATRADVFDDPRELMSRLERRLREGGWVPHRRWMLRAVNPAVA